MSENQFVVETVEITDCDTDVSRIAKVITDTKETYSYEDLDEIVDLLNEADFVREDLRIEKSRNDNMKISLHHFRRRCLKFEVGLKDVVGGHEDLRKFAKRMGVI